MRIPLDALRSLDWPARRRASGTRSGVHPSALRGRAPELSAYRAYRPGDDVRDMDWKLLARSDRAYVRLSEDRAIHATRFLVDATASMAFPEGTRAKWRHACAVVEGLAFLAHRAGDPVGVRVVGGTAPSGDTLVPSTRRDVVAAAGALLDGVTPGGASPLAPAFEEVPSQGRVVIVSDLLGDARALLDVAGRWSAGAGDLTVVHVLSAEEWHPSQVASVVDPEDPTCERDVGPGILPAYAAALGSWVREQEEAWRDLGAAFHRVVAEEDPVPAVRRIALGSR